VNLSDLYAEPSQSERLTDERVELLWPQARGELWAYAHALERGGAGLTAAQLRMAVQLADEAVGGRRVKGG
jgi:hypothetical protein